MPYLRATCAAQTPSEDRAPHPVQRLQPPPKHLQPPALALGGKKALGGSARSPDHPAAAAPEAPPERHGWLRALRPLDVYLRPPVAQIPTRAIHPNVEREYREEVELPVEGALPAGLSGTLYRLGPAVFNVFGVNLGHLFDGDGLLSAIRIANGRAFYQSAFVATRERQHEQRLGAHIFPGFGTRPRRGLLGLFSRLRIKNASNITPFVFDSKLYTSSDVGWPYRLDRTTLRTEGIDDLGLGLAPGAMFSPHPKTDRRNGDAWSFGVDYGRRVTLNLMRLPRGHDSADAAKRFRIPLDYPAILHDFSLSDGVAAFLVSPFQIKGFPLRFLLGLAPPIEAMEWAPHKQTKLLLVDLDTGTWQTAPCERNVFALHHVASWRDPDGSFMLDTCAQPVPAIFGATRAQAAAVELEPTKLTRLRWAPEAAQVTVEVRCHTPVEFPRRLHAVAQGSGYRHAFFLGYQPDLADVFAPTRIDSHTGAVSTATLASGETAREGIPVAKPGTPGAPSADDGDALLLSLVTQPKNGRTDLRIYDGGRLEAGHICRMPLPQCIPNDIHGNWSVDGADAID